MNDDKSLDDWFVSDEEIEHLAVCEYMIYEDEMNEAESEAKYDDGDVEEYEYM